ncbi:MAG: AAA family ATPase [Magnetococcales bacterium]|nr:AAA family ATPase [Magnetococcales bacterium]
METLTLSIENFGGITAATLSLYPGLTLVAGANGASKTTILRAIAACSRADTVIPIVRDGRDVLLKKDSGLLVRGKSGSATLAGAHGSRRVVWPSNGSKGTGPFDPVPSRMALGLIDWMATPQVDRLRLMMDVATLDPTITTAITRANLDQAVAVEQLDSAIVDWAWQVITNNGFDAAHAEASKAMTESTGSWKATTHEAYGEEKAKIYLPQGWEPDLATATQEGLKQTIHLARTAVDHAIANQAMDAAETVRIGTLAGAPMPDMAGLEKELAAAHSSYASEIADAQQALLNLQQEPQAIIEARNAMGVDTRRVTDLQNEMAAMQSGAPRVNGACPWCEQPVFVTDGGPTHGQNRYRLNKPAGTQLDQTRVDTLNKQIAALRQGIEKSNAVVVAHVKHVADRKGVLQNDLNQDLENRQRAVKSVEARINAAKRQMADITSAKSRLAEIQAKSGGIPAERLATLRQELARAEARWRAWDIKVNADRYAEDARQFGVIKKVTAPGGLRQSKMDGALSGLNARCAALSAIAQWGPVSLEADGDLFYAGRPLIICSRAEQYRCRITIQVMLATLETSPILLIDDADVLDANGRMGLVNMLRSTGISTLIAMTAKRDYAEAVATLFDSTLWVEGGIVIDISPAMLSEPDIPPEDPALADYKAQLAVHDFLYEMADDGAAYQRGKTRHENMIAFAKLNGDEYKRAFNVAFHAACLRIDPIAPVAPVFPEVI